MLPWLPLIALAHGPPAAVLGVASYDDEGPVQVVLTEGLAVRVETGWQYVCPSRWGGLPLAPFAAGVPEAVYLPGWDDVYQVDRVGGIKPIGDPRHAVTDLLDLDGTVGVWSIYVAGDHREIVRLGAQPLSFNGGGAAWSGVLGGAAGASLVGARDGALILGELEETSGLIEETSGFPLVGTSPQLVFDGATPWVLDRASGYVGLHRLADGMLVAQATSAVEGPLRVGDLEVVALDGELYALEDSGPSRLPEVLPVGCLVSGGTAQWACSGDLYALTPDGLIGEPVVPLSQLTAPDLTGLTHDETVACWGEWRTFALDLAIDPGPLPEDPGLTPTTTSRACAAHPAAAGIPGWFSALIFFYRRATRRRCFSVDVTPVAWHRAGAPSNGWGEVPRATSSTAREQRGTRRGAGDPPPS